MPKLIHTIAKRVRKFRKDRKSNRNAFLIFAAVVMVWCGIANLLDDGKLWELEWEWEVKENTKK